MLARLPRPRPEDLLRGQRPVGRARGPGDLGHASSRRTGSRSRPRPVPGPGVLADQRVRAAEASRTSRPSSRWAPTRPSRDLRQVPDPAAARHHPGARARRRSPTSSATTRRSPTQLRAFKQADAKVALRQPADAAGGRRPALRAAALHAAQGGAGNYPVLRFVLVVLRRRGRHRVDARRRRSGRARRDDRRRRRHRRQHHRRLERHGQHRRHPEPARRGAPAAAAGRPRSSPRPTRRSRRAT